MLVHSVMKRVVFQPVLTV